MKRPLLVAAMAVITACNPYLAQRSVAPPGRTARLDTVDGFWGIQHYRLEVSRGVTLAMTCYKGGPCEKLRVTSDDPAIAEVRLASLATLEGSVYGSPMSSRPSSAFVVIGKAPGSTKVHVAAAEGRRDIVVTVIAPPGLPVAATSPVSGVPTP